MSALPGIKTNVRAGSIQERFALIQSVKPALMELPLCFDIIAIVMVLHCEEKASPMRRPVGFFVGIAPALSWKRRAFSLRMWAIIVHSCFGPARTLGCLMAINPIGKGLIKFPPI